MRLRSSASLLKAAPQRVAVFRALAVGDLLCAVPALRAMRQAWVASHITLIGLPWANQFAERFGHYIDRFVEFPGYPGLPEQDALVTRIPEFLAAMQRERFDLAVQLHGSGRFVNDLVALLGAQQTAGFFLPGDYRPDVATFAPWPQHGLEIHRLLSLVDSLGLPSAGDALEFPLTSADEEEFARLADENWLALRPYVVVHAGASVAERRWPAERFAAVADALGSRGFGIVLTGVAGEQPIARSVANKVGRGAIDLAGRTSLGGLGALVARAALVVCNDTAISHVAAALKTPSVVISTGDNPARWSPIDRQLHRVLCSPRGVSVVEACRAAQGLLDAQPVKVRAPERRREVIGSPIRKIACDQFAS